MSGVPEGPGRRPGLERGVRPAVPPQTSPQDSRKHRHHPHTQRPSGPLECTLLGFRVGLEPCCLSGTPRPHDTPTGPSPSTLVPPSGKGQKGAPAPPNPGLLFLSADGKTGPDRVLCKQSRRHVAVSPSQGPKGRGGSAFSAVAFTGPAHHRALQGMGPESQEER